MACFLQQKIHLRIVVFDKNVLLKKMFYTVAVPLIIIGNSLDAMSCFSQKILLQPDPILWMGKKRRGR